MCVSVQWGAKGLRGSLSKIVRGSEHRSGWVGLTGSGGVGGLEECVSVIVGGGLHFFSCGLRRNR